MIDVRELNEEFFTRCFIKYENGFAYIDPATNNVLFESLVSGMVRPTDIKQLKKSDGSPLPKILLSKEHKVAARLTVEQEGLYIIVTKDNFLSVDGTPVDMGDVVLLTNPIRFYDNYRLFASEIRNTKLPDLKDAVKKFKEGKRGNYTPSIDSRPISNEFNSFDNSKDDDEDVFTFDDSQEEKGKYEASGWDFDKNANLANAQYYIKKILKQRTANGGVITWGYLLVDNNTQAEQKFEESKVLQMASSNNIKNAKVVVKNGRKFLQGVGCSIDNMEQDWA